MAIKGIIFDKDGTLFNYAEVWGPVVKDCVDTMLMTFSVKNEEESRQYIYEVIGVDDKGNNYPDGFLFNHDKVVRIFFRLLGFCIRNRINPIKLYRLMMKFLYSQNRKVLIKLRDMDFSPLQALMADLNRRGIVIGLVTNDITSNAKNFMDVMGIDRYVRFLRTKESNCKPKPNDESIRQFAATFGFEREEIAVVGDSLIDMQYAKGGGVGYKVAVMTGYGRREILEKNADRVYDTILDLASDPLLFPEGL